MTGNEGQEFIQAEQKMMGDYVRDQTLRDSRDDVVKDSTSSTLALRPRHADPDNAGRCQEAETYAE